MDTITLSVHDESGTFPDWDSTKINNLLPEVLENVFNQLNAQDLKSCRLVCHQWNAEIKAHVPQSVIVVSQQSLPWPTPPAITATDMENILERPIQTINELVGNYFNLIKQNEESMENLNVQFIHGVNKIKSLHLLELRQRFYATLLKEHQQKRLQQLKISCTLQDHFIQLVLHPCTNLKVLEISDVALNSCDFQSGWSDISSVGARNWYFLPNLQALHKYEENTYIGSGWNFLYGNHIQLNSKNITFLLRRISSLRMKTLQIKLDTRLRRVNSCVGRRAYRFEDMDLQVFICNSGRFLEELELEIPLSMPRRLGVETPKSLTIPTSLKSLKLEISTGSTEERGMNFRDNELLEYDTTFYNQHAQEKNFYWNALSLAQTQLRSYEITLKYDLSPSIMENVYLVLEKNKNTLEKVRVALLITDFWNDIEINGVYFEGTKLLSLQLLTVISGDPPAPVAPEVYRFRNFNLLPKTITTLTLHNTKLDREDFLHLITNLTSLKHLDYMFMFPFLFSLGAIENLAPVLESLVHQCTTYCGIGLFGDIVDEDLRVLLNTFGTHFNEEAGFLVISGGFRTAAGEGGGGDA